MTNQQNINDKFAGLLSKAKEFCESCENIQKTQGEDYVKVKGALRDIERYKLVQDKQLKAAQQNLPSNLFKSIDQTFSSMQMIKNILESLAIIYACLKDKPEYFISDM